MYFLPPVLPCLLSKCTWWQHTNLSFMATEPRHVQLSGAWIYYEITSLLYCWGYVCPVAQIAEVNRRVVFVGVLSEAIKQHLPCWFQPSLYTTYVPAWTDEAVAFLPYWMGSTFGSSWEACARLEGSLNFHMVELVCYWINVSIKCW